MGYPGCAEESRPNAAALRATSLRRTAAEARLPPVKRALRSARVLGRRRVHHHASGTKTARTSPRPQQPATSPPPGGISVVPDASSKSNATGFQGPPLPPADKPAWTDAVKTAPTAIAVTHAHKAIRSCLISATFCLCH